MTELNELDKEYIELCNKDVNKEEDRKMTVEMCLEEIKKKGNIQEKGTDWRGFTTFTFADGFTTTIAPRRYKFSGPLIPEGMDPKQFEQAEVKT